MPSPLHQAFVAVLQRHLDCALKLARIAGVPFDSPLEHWSVVSGEFGDPGNLGRVYLADLALAATGPDGKVVETLILEPQLNPDPGKYLSRPRVPGTCSRPERHQEHLQYATRHMF